METCRTTSRSGRHINQQSGIDVKGAAGWKQNRCSLQHVLRQESLPLDPNSAFKLSNSDGDDYAYLSTQKADKSILFTSANDILSRNAHPSTWRCQQQQQQQQQQRQAPRFAPGLNVHYDHRPAVDCTLLHLEPSSNDDSSINFRTSKKRRLDYRVAIDWCTCAVCLRGALYLVDDDEDDSGYTDDIRGPFTCTSSNNGKATLAKRWTIIGLLSCLLPCLLCYIPAQLCTRAFSLICPCRVNSRRNGNKKNPLSIDETIV